jgi:hypothetical protein
MATATAPAPKSSASSTAMLAPTKRAVRRMVKMMRCNAPPFQWARPPPPQTPRGALPARLGQRTLAGASYRFDGSRKHRPLTPLPVQARGRSNGDGLAHPNAVVLVGIAEHLRTLGPCCRRFSAPLVERIFSNRSKSSTGSLPESSLSFRENASEKMAVLYPEPEGDFHGNCRWRVCPPTGGG